MTCVYIESRKIAKYIVVPASRDIGRIGILASTWARKW